MYCHAIVDAFMNLHLNSNPSTFHTILSYDDKVLEYAIELLTLGLLHVYTEFTDAIREGDGLRIHHCWKFMFMHQEEQTTLLKHLECSTTTHFFFLLDKPNSFFGVVASIPLAGLVRI